MGERATANALFTILEARMETPDPELDSPIDERSVRMTRSAWMKAVELVTRLRCLRMSGRDSSV